MAKSKVLIKDGLLFDGSNSEPLRADVLIEDGRVKKTGPNIKAGNAQVIDAAGKWVMPGFIDIHTHYDAEVEVMPGLEESVRHGVTSVIFGNCSLSCALGSEEDLINLFCRVENLPADIVEKWIRGKMSWNSPAEYYDHLDTLPIGPNIASFLGHSEIRIAAMGLRDSLSRPRATSAEIAAMQGSIREALDAGFLGLSIDLLPFHRMFKKPYNGVSVPSQQAHHSEYSHLADVVREYDRVLQAVPNAMSKISVIKIMSMSSGIGRRPLKTTIIAAMDTKSDRKVHKLAPGLAKVFNGLLGAEIKWQALAEPFLNFADGPITPLFEEFPSAVEAISAGEKERRAMFADPVWRRRFKKEWNGGGPAVFHRNLDDMWIVDLPGNPEAKGKSIAALARANGAEPLDFFISLLAKHDTGLRWRSAVTNDRDEIRIGLLADANTMIGFSDSGAHNRNMAFYDFGLQTLKQARQRTDILPVHTAVHRLSGRIADWFGLDTGYIQPGRWADITVINPVWLSDGLGPPVEILDKRLNGAMRMVKRSPKVVEKVFIGGNLAFDNGKFSKKLGKSKFGRLLRAGAKK